MNILAEWISDNQYGLTMAGNTMELLGIVIAASSGVWIVHALRKAAVSLGEILFMLLALLLQAAPFVIGFGLYRLIQHTEVLTWLIPPDDTRLLSRGEAIWLLIRWSPFILLVFILTGGLIAFADLLTKVYKAQKRRLAPHVQIGAAVLVNRVGILCAITGALINFAVDAVVTHR